MSTMDEFLAAVRTYHEAHNELSELVARLRSFVDRVSAFPGETCFTDVPDEPAPPLDDLMKGGRWFAPEFPSPQRIQELLRKRFIAANAASRLYDQLPAAQRSGYGALPKIGAALSRYK